MSKIKEINIDGCALVIVDQALFNKYNKELILNKIHTLNLKYIYNTIAYGVKVVETCYELINEQAVKYDNLSNQLPLIVLKDGVTDFIYNKELTKIKSVNEIMKELVEMIYYNNYKYIILTENKTTEFNQTKDIDNQNIINIIDEEEIYISVEDFLEIDKFNVFETKGFPKYEKEIPNIYLTDIIYTYLCAMNKAQGTLEKIDENTYQIVFKKYKFKILLIDSYTKLYNEEIDISDYDLIIETDNFEASKNNVLVNPDVLDAYQLITKPGIKFKEL